MKTLTNPPSLGEHLPAGKRTAVLFIMSSCPFCRRFRPSFAAFASSHANELAFLTVVLDDERTPLWDLYRVSVVPTVLLFDGESVARRLEGRPGEGLIEEDLALLGSNLYP